MSEPDRLNFCLENYHAVKKAQLRLNGMTVLCGMNGCGKSTLLRWLYYLLRGLSEYRNYAVESFIRERLSLFDAESEHHDLYTRLCNFALLTAKPRDSGATEQTVSLLQGLKHLSEEIDQSDSLDTILERCDKTCRACAESLTELLVNYLQTAGNDLRSERHRAAFAYRLKLSPAELTDEHQLRPAIRRSLEESEAGAYSRFGQELRVIKELVIKYGEKESFPEQMLLREMGVTLFGTPQKAAAPVTVKRVYYIDTPLQVGEMPSPQEGAIWRRHLAAALKAPDLLENDHLVKALSDYIAEVTGGRVQRVPRAELLESDEALKFKLPDGSLIDLNRAATGVKSFAYIERLLKTGSLDRHSVLLIDEPEAHLHPQWITKFAHLLLRLHQELGVCVVLSSHGPDLVQALHTLSDFKGMQESSAFYLAEPVAANQYIFEEQTDGIENIFSTFNLSYDELDRLTSTNNTYAAVDRMSASNDTYQEAICR
ncbi:MAG: AAA family ATPase [Succinivibrio sp.]|nr:AAA family ATPase [Succinivibrio sp.]